MKKLIVALVSFALLCMPAPASSGVFDVESHIWTDNISDTGAWVTVYDIWHSIKGAWCVGPHSFDKHGLKTKIFQVRFEVAQPNCGHPVHLDETKSFESKSDYSYTHSDEFKVEGTGGRYRVSLVKIWS